ncbi:MAG: rod shape-determining protein RodA [Paludibacteraceae bacterium]|nr:rod shape-determining protein RodA [Paludibacteraceae bacterium]
MQNVDWFTIGIYIVLVIAGWFSIYGAVYNFEDTPFWDFSVRYGKQLVWIGCSIVIAIVLLSLDNRVYSMFAYVIYGIAIISLIVTLIVAPDIKGSRSWLVLGPVSIQPAEFAKTATCLAIAKLMSSYGFRLGNFSDAIKVGLLFALPPLLIVLQQETGSALVYAALFLVLYREGMPGVFLFLGLCAVVFFIVAIRFGEEPIIPLLPDESYGVYLVMLMGIIIQCGFLYVFLKDVDSVKKIAIGNAVLFGISYLVYKVFDYPIHFTVVAYISIIASVVYYIVMCISRSKFTYVGIAAFMIGSVVYAHTADYAFSKVLQPHQQIRIKVTLGMINDPQKADYNVNQSKIAIGSGGFAGKGFLNGTQTKLKYVPEQDTDFIFCTVGEEHGFLGSVAVLSLFLVLILRLIYLAERQRALFNRIYGYCVASIFFFHLAINIGMVLGLTPVIGIPLPFFSYGGSSLWGFSILLFIFLRLDASRMEYMAN